MSEYAEQYRRQNREKAKRLTSADPHQSVDASGWTAPEPLNADVKTGMRPISRRQYKAGGKVHGEGCAPNAGRTQRKAGGRLATELMNRDQREANEAREGKKHVGGFKSGGRTERAGGGLTPEEAAASVPTSRMAFQSGPSMLTKAAGLKKGGAAKREKRDIGGALGSGMFGLAGAAASRLLDRDDDKKAKKRGGSVSDGELEGARPTGGRMARKHGGSAGKGKMNVNIVIAQPPPRDQDAPPPMPMAGPPGPPPHPIMPPPVQPPAGGGAPPGLPMTLGAGPPAGLPPMPRRKGGRVHELDAGAGSGLGRLEKVGLYGAEAKR